MCKFTTYLYTQYVLHVSENGRHLQKDNTKEFTQRKIKKSKFTYNIQM